jgi:dTMP kinase
MTDFRGKWIVVEGPDRIGKTTLIRNLQHRITHQGLNVMTNGFPRRSTPIGKLLDKSLKTHGLIKDWKAQTLTFLSDMLEAQRETTLWRSPENGSGVVITDRYTMSTYAYAKAQHDISQLDDDAWLMCSLNLVPQPDIYVLLTPEEGDTQFLEARSGYGADVTESSDIQQKVITHLDEFVTRQEIINMTNTQFIRVTVSSDDAPEMVCDRLVMPELEKFVKEFTTDVGVDEPATAVVNSPDSLDGLGRD